MVKQANILVVDDEATVREVVRKYLEHDGFHVIEAESGTQALDCVRDQHPDLIVLDVMLPGPTALRSRARCANRRVRAA